MKRAITATLLGGAIVGSLLGAGTANATPPCQINWELDPATGLCKPYYSTTTGGCNPNTVKGFEACLGGGEWLGE